MSSSQPAEKEKTPAEAAVTDLITTYKSYMIETLSPAIDQGFVRLVSKLSPENKQNVENRIKINEEGGIYHYDMKTIESFYTRGRNLIDPIASTFEDMKDIQKAQWSRNPELTAALDQFFIFQKLVRTLESPKPGQTPLEHLTSHHAQIMEAKRQMSKEPSELTIKGNATLQAAERRLQPLVVASPLATSPKSSSPTPPIGDSTPRNVLEGERSTSTSSSQRHRR